MSEAELSSSTVRRLQQRLRSAGWGDYLDALAPVLDALGFVIAQVLWMLAPFDHGERVSAWAHFLEMTSQERAALEIEERS